MKKILYIVLCLINYNAFSRDLTCLETKFMTQKLYYEHYLNPILDENSFYKALETLLKNYNPDNQYIFVGEQEKILLNLFKNKELEFAKYESGDCSAFYSIYNELEKGRKRYSEYWNHVQITKSEKFEQKIKNENDLINYISYQKNFYTQEKLHYQKIDFENSIIVTSFLEALDPHSNFFNEKATKNFTQVISGEEKPIIGIGFKIVKKPVIGLRIKSVTEGSPAALANLKIGDIITSINKYKIKKDVTFEIFDKLNTENPLDITFDVLSGKAHKIVKIKKKLMNNLIEFKEKNNILVIRISSFYNNEKNLKGTTYDVYNYLEAHKTSKFNGIVIDLRENAGGLLDEAIGLSSLFINNPLVVMVKDKNKGIHKVFGKSPDNISNLPLVVLTSKYTASASEIFAGVIKLYGRGLIVGDQQSLGKGSIQQTFHFDNIGLGLGKVTTSRFYLGDGSSNQAIGVKSDIVIPSLTQFDKISENSLLNRLDNESIAGVVIPSKINESTLNWLKANSENRVKKIQSFELIAKNINNYESILDKNIFENDDILNESIDILKDWITLKSANSKI